MTSISSALPAAPSDSAPHARPPAASDRSGFADTLASLAAPRPNDLRLNAPASTETPARQADSSARDDPPARTDPPQRKKAASDPPKARAEETSGPNQGKRADRDAQTSTTADGTDGSDTKTADKSANAQAIADEMTESDPAKVSKDKDATTKDKDGGAKDEAANNAAGQSDANTAAAQPLAPPQIPPTNMVSGTPTSPPHVAQAPVPTSGSDAAQGVQGVGAARIEASGIASDAKGTAVPADVSGVAGGKNGTGEAAKKDAKSEVPSGIAGQTAGTRPEAAASETTAPVTKDASFLDNRGVSSARSQGPKTAKGMATETVIPDPASPDTASQGGVAASDPLIATPQPARDPLATPASAPAASAPAAVSAAVARSSAAPPVPYGMLPMEIGIRTLGGQRSINVRLDPADLGSVEISLQISKDSEVSAKIKASNPHTLAMMLQDAPAIRHALEQTGLKTTESSLQFSGSDDGRGAGQNSGDQPRGQNRTPNGRDPEGGFERITTAAGFSPPSRTILGLIDVSI